MKVLVKTTSPVPLILPLFTMVLVYFLPLAGWAQVALFAIATGAIGGFAARPFVEHQFEPASSSLASKRRVVATFALARLAFGFCLIGLAAALFGEAMMPAAVGLGGYLAGSTLAAPLSDTQLAGD